MGESPILASNRNAFQTTSRETSYRLDVRISAAEETSGRKGMQGVRILLLKWQENLQGGTFRGRCIFCIRTKRIIDRLSERWSVFYLTSSPPYILLDLLPD